METDASVLSGDGAPVNLLELIDDEWMRMRGATAKDDRRPLVGLIQR